MIIVFGENNVRFDINVTIVGDNILEDVEQFYGRLETSDPDVTPMPERTRI